MKRTAIILCLVIPVFALGCSRENRPEGLPKLYPTTIRIMMDGKPLDGASVNLVSENTGQWLVSGQTNGNGIVEILTHGQFKGAPVGNYAVCVKKTHWEEGPTSKTPMPTEPFEQTAYRKKVELERKAYEAVEASFSAQATTPLKMEVTTGKNTQEFEVKSSGKVPLS